MKVKEGITEIPRQEHHPLELRILVACNACGHLIESSWITHESPDRQIMLIVEKCPCRSPLQVP